MKTIDIRFIGSLLLLIVLSLSYSTISAQQVPMYSQYIMNGYLIILHLPAATDIQLSPLQPGSSGSAEAKSGNICASFQTRILKNSYISKSTSVKKR